MKLFYLYLFVISFVAAEEKLWLPQHGWLQPDPPADKAAAPKFSSILQKQDNFDPNNNNTWSMRYIENDQFFEKGGPIFLLIGGEWEIHTYNLQSGQIFEMADTHKGIMFYTEHRYYGYSLPTFDLTLDSLKFLTIEQALEDIAVFIREMKKRPDLANSKVVVIGGSYAGSLATWLREKYPDLVHIAYASSAPILAKYNFAGYNENVKKDLGSKCASVITNGINYAFDLVRQGQSKKVKTDFNLCRDLDLSTYDIPTFIMQLSAKINDKVQSASKDTISNICKALNNGTSDYDSLANYIRDDKQCIPSYASLVYTIGNTALNPNGPRPWFYQLCSEFGFFQTSETTTSLYSDGLPIRFSQQICLDCFGSEWTSNKTQNGITNTNKKYGGLNPNVTHVITVLGTVDPWHTLGQRQNKSLAPVILVEGGSHIQDMYTTRTSDSPQMIAAKVKIQQTIAQWLYE